MDKQFIDAHCHLFDYFQIGTLQFELEQAKSTYQFLCAALADDEYEWYQNLNLPNVKWYAGIHPFYEKSSEKSLTKLVELAEKKRLSVLVKLDWINEIQILIGRKKSC